MPSIPQSLLWISLVVLWLFVLVPMLISKRDAVRRTNDVALATRVLNSAGARRLRRGGPAAGHRSDPDWQPPEEDGDEFDEDEQPPRAVAVSSAMQPLTPEEPDYLDVDVVEEDSGALPVGSGSCDEPASELERADAIGKVIAGDRDELAGCDDEGDGNDVSLDDGSGDDGAADDGSMDDGAADDGAADDGSMDDGAADDGAADDGAGDEYEYVEDTSGLESGDEPDTTVSPAVSRRRMYESKTAAAVSARKYKFRKRVVSVMALILVVSGMGVVIDWPGGKWLFAIVGAITLFYLAYLRRQTRIEERLRRRRMQRMARARLGVANTLDPEFDVAPSRLQRPEGVVLEIDDEDPSFEHLDYAPGPVEYHLPHAAGQ